MQPSVQQIKQRAIFFSGSIEQNFLGHIMAEIYKDRVYSPFLEGRRDLTILDIGAHVGIFSIYAHPYAKKIYAIEPSTEHFLSLQQNIVANELVNVEAVQVAVGNENKTVDFFSNPTNKTMNSAKPAGWQEGWGKEQVSMITLDKLFEENKIEHVDFMKLDVEGSEFEVICGTGFERVAHKIDMVLTEVHSWAGRKPNQIVEGFKNNGFEVKPVKNDATLLVARRKQ